LQLLQQLGWQQASASLSFYKNIEEVAQSGGSNAPVQSMEKGQLSQIELGHAYIKQSSEIPRIGHSTVNCKLEALETE
jgi:hypothetical protein